MIEVEIVKASVRIVQKARELGYIGSDLRPTGKPLKMSARRIGSANGGCPARYVRGFSSGLVCRIDDIMEEVRFLEQLDNWAVDKILVMLRK